MGRSRKGIGGPKTPEGRARALANLKQFQRRHDQHGVYAIEVEQPATRALAEQIMDVIEGRDLFRDSDRYAVGLLAVTLRRIRQAEAYLDERGIVNARGGVRPVAEYLVRLLREAREYCEALGLTPRSRVKLGLDKGRALDLARVFGDQIDAEEESQ